jgi:hypothetical protein
VHFFVNETTGFDEESSRCHENEYESLAPRVAASRSGADDPTIVWPFLRLPLETHESSMSYVAIDDTCVAGAVVGAAVGLAVLNASTLAFGAGTIGAACVGSPVGVATIEGITGGGGGAAAGCRPAVHDAKPTISKLKQATRFINDPPGSRPRRGTTRDLRH